MKNESFSPYNIYSEPEHISRMTYKSQATYLTGIPNVLKSSLFLFYLFLSFYFIYNNNKTDT